MPRTRKNHPPSLKARVAVEALKAHKTADADRADVRRPSDPGRQLEEAGSGRLAGRVRQRPRADAPAGRHREGRTLQADRPTESGVGLSQKKSWTHRLKTGEYGSIQHPGLSFARQCELLGCAALNLLSPAAAGKLRELAADAPARRAVPEAAVFRQPQNGGRTGRESQTDAAADAAHGHRSALRQAQLEPSRAGPPGVSVLVTRCEDRTCKSRLEHRYYVHSDAGRLSVPGGGDGLVQPLRAELGTLEHARHRVLFDRARRGVPLRPTRKSGTPIKARNLRRWIFSRRSNSAASPSAWMAADARSTTCSSNACGAA